MVVPKPIQQNRKPIANIDASSELTHLRMKLYSLQTDKTSSSFFYKLMQNVLKIKITELLFTQDFHQIEISVVLITQKLSEYLRTGRKKIRKM